MLQYLVILGAAVNLGGASYYIKKTYDLGIRGQTSHTERI